MYMCLFTLLLRVLWVLSDPGERLWDCCRRGLCVSSHSYLGVVGLFMLFLLFFCLFFLWVVSLLRQSFAGCGYL